MPATPPPTGYREIQRQELGRLFGQLVGVRLLAAPLFIGFVLWLALVEPAGWRRAVLLTAVGVVPSLFVVEWLRYRRQGFTRASVPFNLTLAVVGLSVITFATGGLASPMLYMMVPVGILTGVFLQPPLSYGLVAWLVAVVWACALLGTRGGLPDFNPVLFGGGARVGGPPLHLLLQATALTLVLVLASGAGRVLRRSFERVLRRAVAAQEESLRSHAERAEELAALSAEIAHELKNPLASIKGLSGLLAQNVGEGKGAQRLGVLRGEVERMQGVLEEFLDFSRPLVPLALGHSDVAALVREVALLHEGLAHERAVGLVLAGAPLQARCDPRKVKQILINLVQNALEASPAGSTVELEVEPQGAGGVRVEVRDRGRGPAAELGERLFEPGVTTKARGSGLGLTIARALARQHGGELTLEARAGGGAVARLVLPGAQLEAPAQEVARG